jgi:hypothetical protein
MDEPLETETVAITILRARAAQTKSVYAFCDVELVVAGVVFNIHGIQVRRARRDLSEIGGTEVCLPTYRDEAGIARPSVSLPLEIREKIADLVLAHLLEAGIAKQRFG